MFFVCHSATGFTDFLCERLLDEILLMAKNKMKKRHTKSLPSSMFTSLFWT